MIFVVAALLLLVVVGAAVLCIVVARMMDEGVSAPSVAEPVEEPVVVAPRADRPKPVVYRVA